VYLFAYFKYLYVGQLVCFILLTWLCTSTFYSIGFVIATGMPARHLMVTTLCFVTFCFAYAGFFVPYSEMYPWMQWTEHVNVSLSCMLALCV
jgi:hypothetical protein